MIEHLVLFKFKNGTSEADIAKVHAGLAALRTRLPEIVDLSVGANFSTRAQGFHSGLVVRLRSRKDLESYAVHPEHVKLVETLIKPIVESVLAVDYEF